MKLLQTTLSHFASHRVLIATTKLILIIFCSIGLIGVLLFTVRYGVMASEQRSTIRMSSSPDSLFKCAQSTSIHMAECNALLSLYESTDGANWIHKDGWLSNVDPCTWYGVHCSGNSVSDINLANNGLSGTLPLKLSSFVSLESLDIATNTLTGPLPPGMIKLDHYSSFKSFSFQSTGICEPTDTKFQDWLSAVAILHRTGILCQTLKANATTGSPGSQFLLSGANYPTNQTFQLLVNGMSLGDIQSNNKGAFSVLLTTPITETGLYDVNISGKTDSKLSLIIKKTSPLRKVQKDVDSLSIPNGIALNDPVQGSWQCWDGVYPDPCHDLISIDMLSVNEGWGVGHNGTILRYFNGIWESTDSPTDNSLNSVKIVSSTLAWAIGVDGTIVRWDGNEWVQFVSPVDKQLNAIDAASVNDAWAVGEKGTILHWDGGVWSQSSTPFTQTLKAIVTISSTDAWAAGDNGILLHWNGTTWTQVISGALSVTTNYSGLSTTSTKEVWLSGNDPQMSVSVVAHLDDTTESWELIDFPYSGVFLGGIDAISSTDVWLFDSTRWGVSYHWNGSIWSVSGLPEGFHYLTSIKMVDPKHGWLAGDEKGLLYWNGTDWAYNIHSDLPPYLTDIQMFNTNDGWIVGGKTPLRWNGQHWLGVNVPSGVGGSVVDILSQSEVWIGGQTLSRWDSNTWVTFTVPLDQFESIQDIDMLSSSDGWAIGAHTILHWDGDSWIKINNPEPTLWLDSISMLTANNGWIVGGGDNYGVILHWDGVIWTKIESPVNYYIWSVDMLSPNNGWATAWASYVGGKDILHWDGKQWLSHTVLPEIISDIDMFSEDFGWVTGQNRMLWWNGNEWQSRKSPSSARRVSTVSPQDAWAIAGTNLLHFVSDVESTVILLAPNASSTLVITTATGVNVSIAIPANTFTQTTNLVLSEASKPSKTNDTLAFAGMAFHLDGYQNNQQLVNFQPQQPLQVTIHYTDTINEDTIKLYLLKDGDWIDAATTCNPTSTYTRRPENNQISLAVCHLSEYALFNELDDAKRIYLPLIGR